jgi:pyruvate dehydrogenase complex dehydrogenase (E1) component
MPTEVQAPANEPDSGVASIASDPLETGGLDVLESLQRRVLWLAMSIVHYANKVRRTDSGVKVGGHQASSASIVSIMTALYFEHLRAPDRVSVKPHASPVLHAINYLLGRLDESYLTELRAFGGLQSYPSRMGNRIDWFADDSDTLVRWRKSEHGRQAREQRRLQVLAGGYRLARS